MWGFQTSWGVVERLGSSGAARGVAGSVTGADAHGNPPEIGVVRDAVRAFIANSTAGAANFELRQRYENALKVQRDGTEVDNVVAITPKGK